MDLILDVDTGVDDALALLLAARSPAVRLLAVTCTGGNAPVDQVVANTLKVLDAAARPHVPVARGIEHPLLEPPAATPRGHGDDGLADLGLPVSTRHPVPEHAVELLRGRILAAAVPVTLVTLARLTNPSVLLRMYPEVIPRIRRLVVMGGAAGSGSPGTTNAPAPPAEAIPAEFNIASDPEAAAIVFGSGLPLLMYGLDVFYGPAIDGTDVDALCGSIDPGASLAGRLLRHQQARRGGQATLGDAGALAAAIEPRLVRAEPCAVRVELAGPRRGQTLVERGGGPVTVDVAFGVDAAGCRSLFLDAVHRNR